MKKVALTLLATVSLALMMALSAGVAAAGWDYEDCPPAADSAFDHASANVTTPETGIWAGVNTNANSHAWPMGDENPAGNPGNKYGH